MSWKLQSDHEHFTWHKVLLFYILQEGSSSLQSWSSTGQKISQSSSGKGIIHQKELRKLLMRMMSHQCSERKHIVQVQIIIFIFSYLILLIQRGTNSTKSWKIMMSTLFRSWLISTSFCLLVGQDIYTRVRSRTVKGTCNAGLLREKSFPTSLVVDAFSVDLVHRLGQLRTVWKNRVNIHC